MVAPACIRAPGLAVTRMMPAPPPRRSAKQRPLNGVLLADGRREAVVVTAHDKRLVINIESDIAAIPLARVRRDDGLNLVRTDRRDWQVRFDAAPAADSWVMDLPLRSRASRLRPVLLWLLVALVTAVALLGWGRAGGLATP